MNHPGEQLRQEIESGDLVSPFIGIYDAFSATIAGKHSPNLFYSGFGFAASHYGLPDIGYIAWPDMVQAAWRIRQILPQHKLLVDIDDGYVDTEVACHVVQQLEQMGVAMVMLEDQARPRRCGHFDGKVILPLEQYLEKLRRVLASRQHLCVLARTDASGDEIFRRVEAFSATDADVLLVDGIRSLEVLREVRKITRKPILFNQIAGGKSPRVTLSELRDAGAALALYSTPCLFAAQTAMDGALADIFGDDGRLPDTAPGRAVGVAQCTSILQGNMNRQAARRAETAGQPRLGEILVIQGAVLPGDLTAALAVQREHGGRLGELLVSSRACSQAQVYQALEAQQRLQQTRGAA
jgi:2-methylisocitrate lyase-like PEP mutase family enzyme